MGKFLRGLVSKDTGLGCVAVCNNLVGAHPLEKKSDGRLEVVVCGNCRWYGQRTRGTSRALSPGRGTLHRCSTVRNVTPRPCLYLYLYLYKRLVAIVVAAGSRLSVAFAARLARRCVPRTGAHGRSAAHIGGFSASIMLAMSNWNACGVRSGTLTAFAALSARCCCVSGAAVLGAALSLCGGGSCTSSSTAGPAAAEARVGAGGCSFFGVRFVEAACCCRCICIFSAMLRGVDAVAVAAAAAACCCCCCCC